MTLFCKFKRHIKQSLTSKAEVWHSAPFKTKIQVTFRRLHLTALLWFNMIDGTGVF